MSICEFERKRFFSEIIFYLFFTSEPIEILFTSCVEKKSIAKSNAKKIRTFTPDILFLF